MKSNPNRHGEIHQCTTNIVRLCCTRYPDVSKLVQRIPRTGKFMTSSTRGNSETEYATNGYKSGYKRKINKIIKGNYLKTRLEITMTRTRTQRETASFLRSLVIEANAHTATVTKSGKKKQEK